MAVVLFSMTTAYAQNKDIKLTDLKTPNSPGFQILDISPSSVERPTNPQGFSVKVLNLFSSGNGIPKNFSFEFSPFWSFKPKDETVYNYLGIPKEGEKLPPAQILKAPLRKFSISLASAFSDSTSGSSLKNTNYIAVGARTNLLTLRTRGQVENIHADLHNATQIMLKKAAALHGPGGEIIRRPVDEVDKLLEEDEEYQAALAGVQRQPLLLLDVAYAYSNAFADNKYANRRFHKSGFWATLTANAQFKATDHFLSFIVLGRITNDNVLKDTAKLVFEEDRAIDYGGKLEYNLKRFSLSVEYVKRSYNDISAIDTERTVGILQYKISNQLYVMGTYGKNFGNINNVFALLGLNWGFGSSPLKNE